MSGYIYGLAITPTDHIIVSNYSTHCVSVYHTYTAESDPEAPSPTPVVETKLIAVIGIPGEYGFDDR